MVRDAGDRAPFSNDQIASCLEDVADELEAQGANPFRVRAYRNGAATLRGMEVPVDEILHRQGAEGLMQLPGIGRSLAGAIEHLVETGRLPLLERLRGEHAAERIFATVPDIGPGLAHRIHEHLGIETLAELQAAANDGRLRQVPGMGEKRIRAVRESLAGRFSQRQRFGGEVVEVTQSDQQPRSEPRDEVPVSELLDIDQEYRQRASRGDLPRIAPRRFNPTREAWLPILHTQRGERHYTALYSNTSRAHQLGTTHDWVVIYRDDDEGQDRWTVITSLYGRLRGSRIVRGRESDCEAYYEQKRPDTLF